MDSSDEEYEEWSPSVLKRWGALMERQERDGKHYTAFLRFALKCYGIPANVKAIWTKKKRGSGKLLELQIEYVGGARTAEEMRRKHGDKLDGVFFDIDAPEDSIKKVEDMIKAARPTDAPEPGARKQPEVFGDPTPEQTPS